MTSINLVQLRELLALVPCAETWTYGAESHAVETSARAANGDIYGRTMFEPDERDEHTLAEAKLICAAVNALPELLNSHEQLMQIRTTAAEASKVDAEVGTAEWRDALLAQLRAYPHESPDPLADMGHQLWDTAHAFADKIEKLRAALRETLAALDKGCDMQYGDCIGPMSPDRVDELRRLAP